MAINESARTDDRPVTTSVDGALATITVNRPTALNALTLETIERMDAALEALDERSDVRAVVLRGSGRAFMAGGDLVYLRDSGEDAPAEASRVIAALNRLLGRLTTLSKPTLASVHGAVAGAGLSLTLACDLAIAADDAKFVYAYDGIGASPDGGLSWTLPRAVGLRKAIEMAFLSSPIGANAALELGLVNRVVAADALEAATGEIAARLATGPTQALVRTRRLMNDAWTADFLAHLEAERAGFCASAATADFREGVSAFFGRRKPQFTGR